MDLNTQELEHFVEAQDKVYANVLDEIAMGDKTSHWMWFIFPQLRELGRSAMAKRFGIAGRDEAMTYLAHPVLGPRLKECVHLLLSQRSSDAHEIFGSPDDLKLRSCLTLFASVTKEEPCFQSALDRFYAGKPDQTTVALLKMPT